MFTRIRGDGGYVNPGGSGAGSYVGRLAFLNDGGGGCVEGVSFELDSFGGEIFDEPIAVGTSLPRRVICELSGGRGAAESE